MSHSMTLTLRGQQVEVECLIAPADPGVGIPNDYVEEVVSILDERGNRFDWMLTQDEFDTLTAHYNDMKWYDYDFDYEEK